MYFSHHLNPYVNTITFFLFTVPFIFLSIKRSTFKPFTFYKLTKTFNRTLPYFAILAIVLSVVMKIIDVTVSGRAK